MLAVLAAFMWLLVVNAVGQDSANMSAVRGSFSPSPYRVGERLSYNVSFSNFPTAAHVELVIAGRGTYFAREGIELRAHVETLDVVSAALYSINNDYISYVDPATGFPFRTQQVIRDGAQASNVSGDATQVASASALPAQQTANGVPGVFDFVSALYRLRALPLAPGSVYPFVVRQNDNEYQAELRVMGREILKTSTGSSNAIAGQVRVRGNKQANDYQLRIYFTDDEWHVPVLITAQHPAGEIRAEIASADLLAPSDSPATAAPNAAIASTTMPPLKGQRPIAPSNPAAINPGNSIVVRPIGSRGVLPGLPFGAGEELNFNFFLGTAPQPIGKASFQVRARAKYFNQDGLLLTTMMQTTDAAQRLFPVNDQISSYVDATTLLPFRTELRLQEGKRRANLLVNLNQNVGSAVFDDGARLEIPVGTHDLLSVFYALRSFDLTPPKRNAVSLLINKRPRLLIVTALQRQTIEVGNQRIPAVQLSLVTDDAQGDRFELRLWMSLDSRRLPLRLTASTPLGPVRADLAIIPVTVQ